MFNGQAPVILEVQGLKNPRDAHGFRPGGNDEDIKFSSKSSYLKITRITDVFPISVILNYNSDCSSVEQEEFYFEAKMTKGNNSIAVGLIEHQKVYEYLHEVSGYMIDHEEDEYEEPDWDALKVPLWPNSCWSYTYHGDTGKLWNGDEGKFCCRPLLVNDVVGCGIDKEQHQLFFTLNGEKIIETFDSVLFIKNMYPIIGFKGEGAEVKINVNAKSFLYQPKVISTKMFPTPETFTDEWTKNMICCSKLTDGLAYDHLKDVTLISKDEQEIKCHGLILSIRSKVFQAMLEPTKNEDNKINIKDFDASTIKKMVWFLYSDKAEDKEIDMELLGIANMYQIEALQIICEKRLCNELDVNNVLDAWVGANLFRRCNFKELCEKFIFSNWLEVQKSESFSRLFQENCEGVGTLMIKLLSIHSNSKEEKEKNS